MTAFAIKFAQLVILFPLLQTAMSREPPAISDISSITNQFVDCGANVEIKCSIENKMLKKVRWMKVKDDNASIVVTEDGVVKDRKYSLKRNFNYKTTTYTLQITDFQKSDEAIYYCLEISSSGERDVFEVQLRVKNTSARINLILVRKYYPLIESIILECQASGFPEPKITWARSNSFANKEIIPGGHEIVVPDALRLDNLVYICQAENGVGPPDIRSVNVKDVAMAIDWST